jgi:type IV secretory pathway TraG/TraD family ATPase VirD4
VAFLSRDINHIGIATALARRSLYGDARFAHLSEANKAGLLSEAGIIAGRLVLVTSRPLVLSMPH